jgi:hypothetical protein
LSSSSGVDDDWRDRSRRFLCVKNFTAETLRRGEGRKKKRTRRGAEVTLVSFRLLKKAEPLRTA